MRYPRLNCRASWLLITLWTTSAVAQTAQPEPEPGLQNAVAAVAGTLGTDEPIDAEVELRRLLIKVGLGTVIAVGAAATLLLVGGRRYRSRGGHANTLQLKDTIGISPKCRVALVQFGGREVLVGHDHTGLRSMVLVPSSFSEALSSIEALPSADDFLNVGDAGWDLTRRT